jgi:hypothetical protein
LRSFSFALRRSSRPPMKSMIGIRTDATISPAHSFVPGSLENGLTNAVYIHTYRSQDKQNVRSYSHRSFSGFARLLLIWCEGKSPFEIIGRKIAKEKPRQSRRGFSLTSRHQTNPPCPTTDPRLAIPCSCFGRVNVGESKALRIQPHSHSGC